MEVKKKMCVPLQHCLSKGKWVTTHVAQRATLGQDAHFAILVQQGTLQSRTGPAPANPAPACQTAPDLTVAMAIPCMAQAFALACCPAPGAPLSINDEQACT